MKRIVCQAANHKYRELAAITVPAMEQWCDIAGWAHQYTPFEEGDNWNAGRYRLVRQLLNEYDAVMWLDVDIVPCAPRDLILDWNKDGLMSLDYNGWCIGAFVYRSTEWSKWFIDTQLQLFPERELVYFEIQDLVKSLMSFRRVREHMGPIPQAQIANLSSAEADKPGVLYHQWANQGYEKAVAEAKERVAAFLAA